MITIRVDTMGIVIRIQKKEGPFTFDLFLDGRKDMDTLIFPEGGRE